MGSQWFTSVTLLMLSICYVSTEILWVNNMQNLGVKENLELGEYVYTLRAYQSENPDLKLVYGFTLLQGSEPVFEEYGTYFRIKNNTGEVFTDRNRLDYEGGASSGIKINIVARTPDGKDFNKRTSNIAVIDVNDNSPKFRNNSMNVFMLENTPVGPDGFVALSNILITDLDTVLTPPQIFLEVDILGCTNRYQREPYPCSDKFELRQTGLLSSKQYTGQFIIKKQLDFEEFNEILVVLMARDGNENNTNTNDIVVTIRDMPDMRPLWIVLPNQVFVDDGTLAFGMTVFVEAVDQDSVKREIYYTLKDGSVNGLPVQDVFEINAFTGEITNIIELDLEGAMFRNYGAKTINNIWQLNILACEITNKTPLEVGDDSSTCTDYGVVNIVIDDINDNAPLFNRDSYEYSISEDILNNELLINPSIQIQDKDTETFNKFESYLLTPSEEFAILGNTSNNPIIRIKNTELIDYDSGPKEYFLTMIARDLENPNLNSTASIHIIVRDVNDNFPYLVGIYEVSIPEDSEETFPVVKVRAEDFDSGEFGSDGIQYTLTGVYSNLFYINPNSGQVTVQKCSSYGVAPCLDYDVNPVQYTIYVEAEDNNKKPGSKKTTAKIIVNLLNVNDIVPTVGPYSRFITEGQTKFTGPLIVQGEDLDSPVLYYSIESQFPGNFWKIDRNSGEITVNKGGEGIKFLDGRNQEGIGGSSFQLVVIVSDNKYEARSIVDITVMDINDNAPTFFPRIYEHSINETTPGGTFLLNIMATDADDPTSENGIIFYNIMSGNIGGRFRIDNKTGDVFVSNSAKFDYDIQRNYTMLAIATDQGQPQLSGSATIIIHILDRNNKNPTITPTLQEFSVSENVNIGYFVGIVGAKDPDKDANLTFRWRDDSFMIAKSNNGFDVDPINGFDFRDLFRIEPNGKIYVNKKLNSRLTNLVYYGVEVRDVKPTPYQAGFGTVIFNILPFNTIAPVFDPYDSPIYLDEEQSIGSGIITLMAKDSDGIGQYAIIQQPDYNFFAMSPTTGSVSILNRIDYDDRRMYNDSYFVAMVSDRGDPILTATANVTVIFRNINDNYPEFVERDNLARPKSVYTATIPENSPDGTPIAQVFAFDQDRPDSNLFHEVRYYMDDDRFDVDPITGQIVVRLRNGAVLDREAKSSISTRVIARDNPNGSPQNSRAAAVIVILTDVNDNKPIFSSEEYYVQIFETMGVDTDILQLFTTDRDIGDNARSYYSKVPDLGDDDGDFFDVRYEKGRIYLKRSVVKHVGRYTFFVQAQDLLGTGFITTAKVIVDVLPSANSPPIYVLPPIDNMTIYVLEEQYNGMLVYDVSARDEDTGVNGIIDYSFIYDGETTQSTPEFKINKVTGVIQAEIVYDREVDSRYVLLLNASDRGDTRLSTTRFLTVVVLDVNDNPPKFADSEIEIRIAENRPLGEIQKLPLATDLDLDPMIVYNIISGNEDGIFELDPVTRMLYLRQQLDREVKSIYYLDVQASNDEPDYTVIRDRKRRAIDPSILTVKILVGDINDEAPRFLQDEYYGCVSARAPFESHIMTVQAIDSDAIGTGVVRYSVTNGHMIGNTTLFGIHEKFGVVTNRVLMRRYADSTFYVTVSARDRDDINTAESADTVAKIFVNQPGNEVKLLITQNTGEVRLYQSQIQSILEQANDLDYVCINDIQDHVIDSAGSVSTLWSDVYVTGIRRSVVNGEERHRILTSVEFMNIINTERYSRKSDFDLLYIREVEAASSSHEIELEDQAVLIIVIIIAVLIFLVIIFCILAFLCIRAAKRHKKEKLLHRTHATPPPMVEQEPVVVEPIIYDNRMFVQEEPPVVQVVEEQRTLEPEPVHVQYAVVQKRSPSPQYVEQPQYVEETVHQYVEDDQDAIVVELKDDEPEPRDDVYEYRIETDLVQDTERF